MDFPIDYSQISLFMKCPMLWRYRYLMGLDLGVHPSASWSKHLIHKPLEKWWLGEDWDWDQLWDRYVTERRGIVDPFYTLDLARAGITGWLKKFSGDRENYELISTEKVVPVPQVPGFVTKPDLVLRRKRDGRVFVKDFKTSRYEKEALLFDRQFLGQVLGYNANGFSRDFFLLKNTKKDGVVVEVTRDEEEVSGDLLDEWAKEAMMVMAMMEMTVATGVFPKNAPDSCFPFPRIKCEMVDYCAMGGLREVALEGFPKKDPLGYLKGEE